MTQSGQIFERLLELVKEYADGKPTVFAKMAGIPHGTFAAYIKGRPPHVEHLCRIRNTYHICIDWILTGKEPKYIPEKNELQVAEKTSSYNRAEKIDDGGLRKLLIGVQKILEQRENEVNILKDLIKFLTDREERIREGDPPEKKDELINMRATSTG